MLDITILLTVYRIYYQCQAKQKLTLKQMCKSKLIYPFFVNLLFKDNSRRDITFIRNLSRLKCFKLQEDPYGSGPIGGHGTFEQWLNY